ncbi:hypothetical protein AJ78_00402 [Emergomyces pasteurianus Ep9510]|uniref:Uncharacterized protein n=1 Tax=Emergomyces pasteurianus Ep9510 TaxID=1447872 RepID=A0A1J9PTU0_9EURO|nr:hypothetical protein AJ78_00402 [Emergomyces pasteurianus Ep9510]
MAYFRGKRPMATPLSPETVIQCSSEIMISSTDWMASSTTYKMKQNVDGAAHLQDSTDAKALPSIDRAVGVLVHAEPSTYESPSSPESLLATSPVSDMVEIDTSLSSFCSSQTPVTPLKSILKNPMEPRSPGSIGPVEFDLEDSIKYGADSDMGEDEEEDADCAAGGNDENRTNDSDWSECYDEDDDIEYSAEEGSFVCFVNSVRFSTKEDICIIPSRTAIGISHTEPEITFHEQAHRMQGSKPVPFEPYTVNRKDYDPNEHSPDTIDLDKQLFAAYLNGLRNMNAEYYQPVVLSRALNAAPYDIDILPITEHQVNAYLDRVVDSLLGFFPYLLGKDEYNRLLDVAEVVTSFDDYNNVLYKPDSELLQQAITHQLERKLADTLVIIENDILGWVAGELIEPLGRHASFRWR